MANIKSTIDIGLPRQPTGIALELYQQLIPVYTAIQALHAETSKLIGANIYTAAEIAALGPAVTARLGDMFVSSVVLTEAVVAGDLLNIYSSSGTKARKASKAAGTKKPAHAIALEAASSGATIKVSLGYYLLAGNFTAGQELYLGTSGALATTKTAVVGEVAQRIGVALTASLALIIFQAPMLVFAWNPQSTATGGLLQDDTGAVLYGSGLISGSTKYYTPIYLPL